MTMTTRYAGPFDDMQNNDLISLRLPAAMREALGCLAVEMGISRSELIRDLVNDFMGES
jgi:predicted DNA-binding protein